MGQRRTGKSEMMSTDMENKDYIGHYRGEYSMLENKFSAAIPQLRDMKRAAMEFFLTKGFPSTKDEEWRFTNLQPLTKARFTLPESAGKIDYNGLIGKFAIPVKGARILLFVNGHYIPQPSGERQNDGGIILRPISQAIKENHPVLSNHISDEAVGQLNTLTALNTGLFSDGVFLQVPDNTTVEDPYYFIFLTQTDGTTTAAYPRNLILTGKNSRITIMEHYVSESQTPYFTNAVSELYLDTGSAVEHVKIQMEGADAFHVSSLMSHQRTGSNLRQHSVMIGGALARNEILAVLSEEGIECTLDGLSLASGRQLIDNHTTIDHTKPNCASHELYKAILDGSSKGVFNGKIYVRKDAQKTDAKQTNKTLLLSDDATMNTKPQLEIFADDVKCTHGAAIGYLDSEAVFYLRSRGISEEIARDLLTYAFANDVISKIPVASVREYLNHFVYARLKQGRELETL